MRNNLPQPYEQQGLTAAPGVPSFGGYEEEEEGGQLNVRRLIGAIVRYKWLVVVLALLGAGAGLVAVSFMPDRYQAGATIWIEDGGRGESGPIRSAELLSASSWVELLRSFMVLDHVILEQRLFLELESPGDSVLFADFEIGDDFVPGDYRLEAGRSGGYRLLTGEGREIETAAAGAPIGREVGFRWRPPAEALSGGEPVEFTVQSPREAAASLREGMFTQLDGSGNFLRIQLQGPSPTRVAGTVNALATRLVDVAGDLKRAKLDELTGILEDQLAYAESHLQEAERELESFRVGTITLPSDRAAPVAAGLELTRDPVFSRFFQLRMELEEIRQDRRLIEGALAGRGEGGLSVEALEVVPSVRGSSQLMAVLGELAQARAELRALGYRYTEEHAPVQEKAEEVRVLEQQTVPLLAGGLARELRERERAIEQQIQSASGELEQIPPRAIEEARLRRQVAVTEGLYTDLQQRYENARLAAASSIPDLRVLDHAAVPQSPLQDEKNMVFLMALAAGLGLGILGALLRDRFDPTIRYADQVTEEMGLTVLGAVPQLGNGRKSRRHDSTAEALEAFRGIRLNVMHAYGSAGPVVLAITSPGPGDGKSLVTSNLALSFGELGRRVLVIDGDIRRGSLHRVLDRERGPGLLDYLGNSVSRHGVVQDTAFENVQFIASGKPSRHGPELVSSPKMRDLLAELKSEYDVILVDTAPLGAGIDPFVFGTLTGNMLLVLRTGSTDRALAEAKLRLAARLPMRFLGVVLNGLPDGDDTYYHRYYSYLPGYEAADEEGAPMLPGAKT